MAAFRFSVGLAYDEDQTQNHDREAHPTHHSPCHVFQ